MEEYASDEKSARAISSGISDSLRSSDTALLSRGRLAMLAEALRPRSSTRESLSARSGTGGRLPGGQVGLNNFCQLAIR